MAQRDLSPLSSPILSRRSFLKVLGVGAVITGVVVLNPRRVWEDLLASMTPMVTWKPKTFTTLVSRTFIVNGGSAHNLAFELIQIQGSTAKIYRGPNQLVAAPEEDCFMLVFRAPQTPALAQNTYQFEHPQLGSFSLFITPGANTEQEQNYTAVINHVHA